ncbi:MAG: EAL domain-containing protein [Peptostreptococcaceae bacterium]
MYIRGAKSKKIHIITLLILGIIVFGVSVFISNKEKIIINKIENTYLEDKNLSQKQIKIIESTILNKKHLFPDEKFILGYYYLFEKNNPELAYNYFEQVVKNISSVKSNFAKVYSYKFLSDKYLEEGDIERGIEFTKQACHSMSTKLYSKNLNIINDIFRPILDVKEGRELIINFLEGILLENEKMGNYEISLYAYRTLEQFYTLKGDLVSAIDASVNTISLSTKLNKDYFKGKSIVHLSRILFELGEYSEALKLLNEVKNIQPNDLEWNDKLNIYRLISLAQLEIENKNYNKVLDYVNELDKYKYNISKEDWQDTKILQYIIKAQIYIKQNKISLATESLEQAKVLIEIDKVVYFPDKDIYYYNILAQLNEKNGNYEMAIEEYKKGKQLAIERNNIDAVEHSISNLQSVYKKVGNKAEYENSSIELIKVKENKKQNISKYSYSYVMKNYELNNIIESDKKIKNNNTILFIISIIVVLLIYVINIHPKIKNKILSIKIDKRIRNNNYILNYQAIVNPKKDEIVGYEALLRLNSKGKVIMPYILIKELEASKKMGEISIYILKQIIKDYALIKEKANINSDFYISMNISILEIEDEKIIEQLITILKQSKLGNNTICIEITENIGIKDLQSVESNIIKLRSAGFKIAIDDFGIEYSNLSMLQLTQYDIVKIDKIFIDNIESSDINKYIIEFCDYMFSKKDKVVIIEGVEEYNQVEFIKNMKHNKFYIQGYYYSKPSKLEDIL